jgi:hypothetical protein
MSRHAHASPSRRRSPARPASALLRLLPASVLVLLVVVGVALLASAAPPASRLDTLATEFTRVALAFGQHKPDEVDSYFGPASLRPPASSPHIPLVVLSQRAHHLVAELAADRPEARDRRARLAAEAQALATVIDEQAAVAASHAASHPHPSFDDEAQRTYGMTPDTAAGGDAVAATATAATATAATAPASGNAQVDARATGTPGSLDAARIDAALASLDRMLPRRVSAAPTIAARFDEYRKGFMIPADRRRAVFAAALDACRTRTAAHWALPAGEQLDVKWDLAAPAAWHRYEGRGRSTLTINPAAVVFVDTAIDLACHEGYPGHHAQFLLADRLALDGAAGAPPIEETVALLRSPVAMLREAAANYAVDLAFPPEERLRFERDTLFPLAGLDPTSAANYFEVRRLVRALEPAIMPILRDYRDGRLSAADAADRLERRALVSSPQALLRFVDDLGPYVLGYTVARDRVAAYVASQTRAGHGDAWQVLAALLMAPDPAAVLSARDPLSAPSSLAFPTSTTSPASTASAASPALIPQAAT